MIQKAGENDLHSVLSLALALWPGHEEAELKEEMRALLCDQDALLALYDDGGAAVGFAQCQLRRDYVEGAEQSPVGYLEGIYVRESHRRRGIARALLRFCEEWAREKGCAEFASDCELSNADSYRFHLKTGFREANRIICFVKKL